MDIDKFLEELTQCREKLGKDAKIKIEIQGGSQFTFIPFDNEGKDDEKTKVINIIRLN